MVAPKAGGSKRGSGKQTPTQRLPRKCEVSLDGIELVFRMDIDQLCDILMPLEKKEPEWVRSVVLVIDQDLRAEGKDPEAGLEKHPKELAFWRRNAPAKTV